MEEIEKLREDIAFLKSSVEQEFKKIDGQFKSTLEFIKSDQEKTEALIQMSTMLREFMEDVHLKFETKKIEINTINIRLNTFETLINTQNIKLNTFEEMLNLKK
jgi:hypothetical protein